MIKLKEVTLYNFLSWRGKTKFQLDNQGLVCISGPNGAGKSSIFDAILWALFGKVTKDIYIEEVVNYDGKDKGCYVEVRFIKEEEKSSFTTEYVVRRYRGHFRFGNRLRIKCNGHTLRFSGASGESEISRLFGSTFTNYLRSAFFTQGNLVKFFSILSESEQRSILRESYGVQVWKTAKDVASSYKKLYLADQHELEGDFNYRRALVDNSKHQIEGLKEKLLELKKDRVESNVDELQKKLKEIESQKVDIQKKIDKISHENESLKRLQLDSDDYTEALEVLNDKIKDVYKMQSCKMCGSTLTKEGYEKLARSYKRERQQVIAELAKVSIELEGYNHTARTAESSRYYSQLKDLNEKTRNIYTEIGRVTSKHAITETKDSLKKEIEKYKILSDQLLELERKTKINNRKIEYYDFWVDGFGSTGLENHILTLALPHFNRKINNYLKRLPTQKGYLKVNYELKKRRLFPTIEYSYLDTEEVHKLAYANLSGGEKRRVDIAISLAFSALSGFNSNVLLFDEPFDGLEPESYRDVIHMLAKLPVSSIFVVTHNTEIKSLFPNVMEISTGESGHSAIESVSQNTLEVI